MTFFFDSQVLHVNMTEAPSLYSHHISVDCDLVSRPQNPTSRIL